MNLFLFRATFEKDTTGGASERLLEGLQPGFIFSSFGLDEKIFTIPYDEKIKSDDERIEEWIAANDHAFNAAHPDILPHSTPEETHLAIVSEAIEYLKQVEAELDEEDREEGLSGADAHPTPKVVIARVKNLPTQLSASQIFHKLLNRHHEAACFLFSTPQTGTWVGATPELLLHAWDTNLECLALAGTRPATSAPINYKNMEKGVWPAVDKRFDAPWDEKNRREHQTVVDFITDTLREMHLKPLTLPSATRRSGAVEHIATEIIAQRLSQAAALARRLNPYSNALKKDLKLFSEIITELSPTPALSGWPRDEMTDFILSHERYPRLCYGGIVGLCFSDGHVQSYVNLRSGRFDSGSSSITLYAGGGITPQSEPRQEWEETEAKLRTIADAIVS